MRLSCYQLAITPQPRVNGEYLNVQAGAQLAVKVEGVIQHGAYPGRFRTVSGVVLTLSTQPSRPPSDNKVPTRFSNTSTYIIIFKL